MPSASAFGNVAIVNNRAVLRSGTAAGLPPCILLLGTTTPLDGGQGFYAVSLTDKSTADDGTNCIVDTAGYRWFLITADTGGQIMAALIASGDVVAAVATFLATPSSANLAAALTDAGGSTFFGDGGAGGDDTVAGASAAATAYGAGGGGGGTNCGGGAGCDGMCLIEWSA